MKAVTKQIVPLGSELRPWAIRFTGHECYLQGDALEQDCRSARLYRTVALLTTFVHKNEVLPKLHYPHV